MKKLTALGALALLLVVVTAPEAPARSSQCSPTRAIFYTSSDWLRLADGLAADPSACAQYYISIAPLTANKTLMRPGAASQVDALGPNFHAVAEVNYTTWANWVSSTGNSWFQAGQAARAAMDAAGFSVAAGDTWDVNEFPSAVRTSIGARQDVEQLVEGLYQGAGSDLPAKGIVFMIGVEQNGVSLAPYKASVESWLDDTTFWTTMSACVSDFMFEAYGDVRDYAVAGEDPLTRIDYLNAFLQHPLSLVSAVNAPPSAAAAKSFLTAAYGPLANASWAWNSDYGWTQVGSDVMADFISAQTYAMRAYAGGARIGFAWNPLNTQSLSTSDFNTEVGGILARLAGSIHETDGGDPTQACEATGCGAVLPGAAPVTGWTTFTSWTPTTATFTSPPLAVTTNRISGPVSVKLETGTVPTTLPVPATLTVSSSSETGTFSASPDGPWAPTLTLTLPAGTSTAGFYTQDSAPGTPVITANLDGALSTQSETVHPPGAQTTTTTTTTTTAAPPLAQVNSLQFVPTDDHMHVALRVVNAAGAPVSAQLSVAVLVGTETVAATTGATATDGSFSFTALPPLSRGCYTAQVRSLTATGYAWNNVSPSGSYCVHTLPARVASLVLTPEHNRMHVALSVTDDSGAPLQAHVSLKLLNSGTTVSETVGATNTAGTLGITPNALLAHGCYTVALDAVTAPGYTWDRLSPSARYCVTSLPSHVASVSFAPREGHLHVELGVVDNTGHPLVANVSFAIVQAGLKVASTAGPTDASGQIAVTVGAKLAPGCYRVQVTAVTAPGFSWDGVSPQTRYCVHAPPKKPAKKTKHSTA